MKAVRSRRHAIYWAPAADHPLWRTGCDWLGRDAEAGRLGANASHREQPRRYGFHATLKPPFALRLDVDETALLESLDGLASDWAPFEMPALAVATLVDFVALRPRDARAVDAAHPLRRLADDCVRRFDPLRKAPSAAEIARRLGAGLSAEQRANVDRWGYPHVFDAWRFHMSLTDSLPDDAALRETLLADARAHFSAALAVPLACDGIALFVEDEPGADLRLARRFPFAR